MTCFRNYVRSKPFKADQVGPKEKILKIHDFLAFNNACFSNRVDEKAFFEENENKMI